MKYFLIAVLWAGYCALHSYLISIRFTKLMSRLLKRYYAFYRLFYILVSFILIVPLLIFTGRLDNEIIVTYSMPVDIIRQVLTWGSLLMFAWAFFFSYDFLSFFGIRQIMNLKRKSAQEGEIRRNGLLGIVRHPMYFALIIYLWCQTFTMMDIVVNAVLTIYVLIGTILEENKLVLEFGDSYTRYQKEVPMLIPFTKIF